MPKVQILLLGPAEIYFNQRSLRIDQRVTKALLFYLAARGGMVGQDELLSLFWKRETKTGALNRLKEAIDELRRSFPIQGVLTTESNLAGLNFTKVSVDLLQFRDLVDQAGRLPWQIPVDKPLPEYTWRLLTQAVALWRSPKFMAGLDPPISDGLAEWFKHTSSHMEHLYSRLLERLAEHAFVVGDLEDSLQYAQRALEKDELNENLHYIYLRNLAQMGRYQDASDYFRKIQQSYSQELEATPPPRLIGLYRQIRSKQPEIALHAPTPHWNIRPSLQAPFIGRKQALDQLTQAFAKGGAAFILGESGQGKTRIIQEFFQALKPPPRLLLTLCRPTENLIPFEPFVELLRQYIQPDEWLNLAPIWLLQLRLLLPELDDLGIRPDHLVFDLHADTAPSHSRLIVLEAIRQILLIVARDRRLLICIDDAQWADESTLAALAYLIKRPPFTNQSLIIVTARREENNPGLEALLNSEQNSPQINLIHLTQLLLDEVSELASNVLGDSVPEQFVAQMISETGGNPFFILEILRAMTEQGSSQVEFPVQLPITEQLQTMIFSRLQLLDQPVRKVLDTASVIGSEFDIEILAEICQLSNAEIGPILEKLQSSLLIKIITYAPGASRGRFIHNKIREVLLQQVPALNQSYLHRQIAQALKRRISDQQNDQAAILAEHLEKAGEFRQAFDYWVRAGQYARQLFSQVEAFSAFGRAQTLIEKIPGLTEEHIYNLFSEWLEITSYGEDIETLRKVAQDLLLYGYKRHSPLLIGTAQAGLGRYSILDNRFKEGHSYANQAILNLEKTNNLVQLVETYNLRGNSLYLLERYDEAAAAYQDSLILCFDSNDPQVLQARSNASYNLSLTSTLNGWPETGAYHAQRALDDLQSLNLPHSRAKVYNALALAHHFIGEYYKTRTDTQTGIELAQLLQSPRLLGPLYGYRAMSEMVLGEVDQAIHYAEQMIDLGARNRYHEMAVGGYRILGDIFLYLSAFEKAAEYYHKSLEEDSSQNLSKDRLSRLGLSFCLNGQMLEGKDLIQKAIHSASVSGLGLLLTEAKTCLAWAYMKNAEWEEARQTALQVRLEAEQRKIPLIWITACLVLGETAQAMDNLAKAREYFQAAAGEAALRSNAWLEVTAQSRLIVTLHQLGDATVEVQQRLSLILDQLEQKTTSPLVRQNFRHYRQKILADLH